MKDDEREEPEIGENGLSERAPRTERDTDGDVEECAGREEGRVLQARAALAIRAIIVIQILNVPSKGYKKDSSSLKNKMLALTKTKMNEK